METTLTAIGNSFRSEGRLNKPGLAELFRQLASPPESEAAKGDRLRHGEIHLHLVDEGGRSLG